MAWCKANATPSAGTVEDGLRGSSPSIAARAMCFAVIARGSLFELEYDPLPPSPTREAKGFVQLPPSAMPQPEATSSSSASVSSSSTQEFTRTSMWPISTAPATPTRRPPSTPGAADPAADRGNNGEYLRHPHRNGPRPVRPRRRRSRSRRRRSPGFRLFARGKSVQPSTWSGLGAPVPRHVRPAAGNPTPIR